MRNGDISNGEAPRMWFVCEGLVLLPLNEKKRGSIRNRYLLNSIVYKRVWDLVWRHDFRCSAVTFDESAKWFDAVVAWFDDVDLPLSLHAYSFDRFVDEIVTLPSCVRVFDPDPRRAAVYGPRGVLVDPARDFEPMA